MVLETIELLSIKVKKLKKENRKLQKENKALNKELETYKKIAEKLAKKVENFCDYEYMCFITGCSTLCAEVKENKKTCKQCIIDWARKGVENGK